MVIAGPSFEFMLIVAACLALPIEVIVYMTVGELKFTRAFLAYLWNLLSKLAGWLVALAVFSLLSILHIHEHFIPDLFLLQGAGHLLVASWILRNRFDIRGVRL